MESNRICSFTGCNNTEQNDNCFFYEFPEDFNLCIQWIEIIGAREYFEDFAFHGPESFRGRYLCTDHFTEEDFVDDNNIYSGLKHEAVPFYFIPNRKSYNSFENISVKNEPLDEEFWDILNHVKIEDVFDQFNISEDDMHSSFESISYENKQPQTAKTKHANETPEQLAERRLKWAQRAQLRRQMETPEQRDMRRKSCAERQARKRMLETPEQKEIRRMKDLLRARRRRQKEAEIPEEYEMRKKANAERQARKRMLETPEQKEIRRMKDLLRTRQRREMETEEKRRIRRIQDAARAQARRQNQSEEEKMMSKLKNLERVVKKRNNETDEERNERLRKNREYSRKKRSLQSLERKLNYTSNMIANTEQQDSEQLEFEFSNMTHVYRRFVTKTPEDVNDAKLVAFAIELNNPCVQPVHLMMKKWFQFYLKQD